MFCITRNDMKFGDYFIPARTKATVINKPTSKSANIPGLYLNLAITLWEMALDADKKKGVPVSRTEIENQLEESRYNTKSKMIGIVITTNGTQVYMDAGDEFYQDASLTKWQLEKIFGDEIPNNLIPFPYSGDRDYYLSSVTDALEDEFSKWVEENCDFHELTEEDIENGEGFDGSCPGDRILSPKGQVQFYDKQLEYKKRLAVTGFTYEFKGGLMWD